MAKPEIQATVERRAARLGLTVDQLIEHDRDFVRNNWSLLAQNRPDCIPMSMFALNPVTIELTTTQLLKLLQHMNDCPSCAWQVDLLHHT